jgi:membrane protease subunit HflC
MNGKGLGSVLRALVILGALLMLGVIGAALCLYTVSEQEQVIITEFGKVVGEPVRDAGLHFKLPLIQTVNHIDKRILEWDGQASEMPTRDKLYVLVDTFGRWRIDDPMHYFIRLQDERSALSRLDDIIGSEVRNAVAKNDLIEIIRTTKDRKPALDPALGADANRVDALLPISLGRASIESLVVKMAAPKLKDFGIELMDVRFMRVNYNPRVSATVYQRMISERQQIASRFRSEGEGEAAKILGNKERELRRIESEAYREVQKVRGEADARATEIYTQAFGASPEAGEFYRFLRTMDTYQKALGHDTMLILSTESDVFRYLKRVAPAKAGTGP